MLLICPLFFFLCILISTILYFSLWNFDKYLLLQEASLNFKFIYISINIHLILCLSCLYLIMNLYINLTKWSIDYFGFYASTIMLSLNNGNIMASSQLLVYFDCFLTLGTLIQ